MLTLRRLLLALALAVGATDAIPARAQQGTEREILDSRRRLEQIRRERARLREEMRVLGSRVHDLAAETRNLDRQVATAADLLHELDVQLSARQEQVSRTEQELHDTQERLTHRNAVLQRRLRDIYKRGPLHTVEVMLTAESFADLLNRYKYLYLIARHDRQLVEEVGTLEEQLVARRRILEQSLRELQRLQEERASEHSQLATLFGSRQRTLASTRAKERAAAQRIAQLDRDERRLRSLVATLERRRKEAERRAALAARNTGRVARSPERATLTTSDLGSLNWPVQGRVLYRFGRQTQPNGTVLRWNGVGIGAAAGTAVRSVEAGTVVMAGPFEGYGPTVVISHGGGYYSLYLYLRNVAVKDGDRVTRGQSIGTVGGERTPEGAHIEFQIRAPGGEAVDPLTWLQKRRS